MYDTIIKGGTVHDGTGSQPFVADIAITGDRIAAVGAIDAPAREVIDAAGLLVTPGFIDIHTHYDGHVTWSERMSPTSQHGVTTIVTGNCGVGFAPCRPEDRGDLILLMEGVEDIPGIVMSEGLAWDWETFPDYLDAIERRRHDVDIATQLPHAALRVYVMGQRAVRREVATAEDNAAMAELARQAMAAGALGFSTSRNLSHRTKAGESIPTHGALEEELMAIALGAKSGGQGVLELSSDFAGIAGDIPGEVALYRRLVEATGMPMSIAIALFSEMPEDCAAFMREVDKANAAGADVKVQTLGRPVGVLQGFALSLNPFRLCPSFASLSALSPTERITALGEPALRARLIAEAGDPANQTPIGKRYAELFAMTDPPDYEPRPDQSIAFRAAAAEVSPEEMLFDLLMADEGQGIVYLPLTNYGTGDLDDMADLIRSDNVLLGLGDAGAHVGTICDGSQPTFMLTHWGRDREGERLPLPFLIQAMTSTQARAMGLLDRGVIAPGYKADINLIDFDRLRLGAPYPVRDLPAGGLRMSQDCDGIALTMLSGEITYRGGKPTEALPGRLIRGMQPAPAVGVHAGTVAA